MLPIYILTFHGSVNYGAVMQATALYTTLSNLGANCQIIDYNRKRHHKNFLWNEACSWKAKLLQLPKYFTRWPLHIKFNAFVKNNMKLTSNSYNGFDSIHAAQFPEKTIYIVGSDQIWNYKMTNNDTHYFLDFINSEYKYAYAASFGGTEFSENDFTRYKDLLHAFKGIGVREESGRRMLEKWSVQADVVCDPTLLLSHDEWMEKATKIKYHDNYVLLYLLSNNSKIINAAKDFAKRNGLLVLNIAYSVKKIPGIIDIQNASPSEWITFINNASCIFTDSFHGFLFSLNFRKQVYVGLNGNKRDARLIDAATRYEAQDCIIDNANIAPNINYSIVSEKLEQDKNNSLIFLRNILNAC